MCQELVFACFCCWIICPVKLLKYFMNGWVNERYIVMMEACFWINAPHNVPGRTKKRIECSVSCAAPWLLNQQRCRIAQQRRYLRIVVLVELQKTGENCGVLFKVFFQGQTTNHSWHNLHKSGSLKLKHAVLGGCCRSNLQTGQCKLTEGGVEHLWFRNG